MPTPSERAGGALRRLLGRRPAEPAASTPSTPPAQRQVERAERAARAGFRTAALERLGALAPSHPPAAVALARLRLAEGDAEGCLAALDLAAGEEAAPRLRVEALLRLGRTADARAAVPPAWTSDDAAADDVLLASAVLPADDAARAALLSLPLVRAGLAAVRAAEAARPLGLDNLVTDGGDAVEDGPLVSVVMPAHQAEATLEHAATSVLAQTWRRLELIVVDDGSTDATAAVAERLAASDPRVRVVRREAAGGAYAARDAGLDVARGELVTVQDADDWSHAQRIERQVRPLLDDPALVATETDLVRTGPDLVPVSAVRRNYSSFLVRRAALDAVGVWDVVRAGADDELVRRVLAVHGDDALRRVLPGVPLCFALSAPTSLTNAGRTGLASGLHAMGARHQYAQAHARWRASASFRDALPYDPRRDPRPFPVPAALVRGARDVVVDEVLVADLSEGSPAIPAALARAATGAALLHHPVLDRTERRRLDASVWDAVDAGARLLSNADAVRCGVLVWVAPADPGQAPQVLLDDWPVLEPGDVVVVDEQGRAIADDPAVPVAALRARAGLPAG